jgi:PKD repeat protein
LRKPQPLSASRTGSRSDRLRRSGQSLAEFAIIVPVFLLLVLVATDFGRVYLGWINLQTMARTAANYAANNIDGWEPPFPDIAKQGRYQEIVDNDATFLVGCTLPASVPNPEFPSGYNTGDLVHVSLTCQFGIITPIISQVIGGQIPVTASATMPVKTGVAGGVAGGGGPPTPAPVAEFVGAPQSGFAPLSVDFTDQSTNNPSIWSWNFGDSATSSSQNPSHTYSLAGTYTVRLQVTNAGGSDLEIKTDYITVLDPPSSGPIAEFSANPTSGDDPLTVGFTDLSTGSPTSWQWDFGDGASSTAQNPSHTYTAPGSYDVTLTVSDGTDSNSQTKSGYINVNEPACIVPNFANVRKNDAQGLWDSAGFTTQVQFLPGNGNYRINQQSIPGGQIPLAGCDATITVGP